MESHVVNAEAVDISLPQHPSHRAYLYPFILFPENTLPKKWQVALLDDHIAGGLYSGQREWAVYDDRGVQLAQGSAADFNQAFDDARARLISLANATYLLHSVVHSSVDTVTEDGIEESAKEEPPSPQPDPLYGYEVRGEEWMVITQTLPRVGTISRHLTGAAARVAVTAFNHIEVGAGQEVLSNLFPLGTLEF